MSDEPEPTSEDEEEKRPRRREDRDDRPRRRDDFDERPRRRDERDDYDDERPLRRREPQIEATDFLIPTGVSRYSMAACYLGLFSCIFPIIGFLMALVAVICGIKALRQRKKHAATYGSVTGDIRAVVGLCCGGLTIAAYLAYGILVLAKVMT